MTSTLRLLADHLRAGIRASVLLAVLVAVTVFIVAIVPRAAAAVATAELSFQLGQEKTVSLDLSAEGRLNFDKGSTADEMLTPIGDAIEAFPSSLPHPFADGVGGAVWVVKSSSAMGQSAALDNTRLSLRLAIDLGFTERLRYVSGEAPLPWAGESGTDDAGTAQSSAEEPDPDELGTDTSNPIDIAISQESATLMKLSVGDIVQYSPAPLRVAGIYEPTDPEDSYWSHTYDLARA